MGILACCDKAPYLQKLLGLWSTDINVVVYVRRPDRHYRSMVQQQLKASSTFTDPAKFRIEYKSIIQSYEQTFPGRVHVVPFNLSRFYQNCIVRDFINQFVPEISPNSPQLKIRKSNPSPPPEVTYCVQKFRKVNFPECDNVFNVQTNWLHKNLAKVAQQHPGREKVNLFSEVSQKILHTHKDDLLWLRGAYGIEFTEIDYSELETSTPPKLWKVHDFADIVPVNKKYASRLERQIIKLLIDQCLLCQNK